jgi:ferredoxin
MKYLKGTPTIEYDESKCTGCGMCAEVCPREVFVMKDLRAALTDTDRCMECGACAKNCAYSAIKVAAGVGCAAAIINGMISGGEPVCGCGTGGGSSSACC